MKNRRQKEKIRYDRYFFSAGEWVRYLAAGCGLGGFAVWLCYHTWMAVPVGVPLAVWYIAGKKKQLAEDRRKRLNYHFRKFSPLCGQPCLQGIPWKTVCWKP